MIAALIIGAFTAWHLGLRAGVVAAAVSFGALLAATFIPGISLTVYLVLGAWVVALYFLGPRIALRRPAPKGKPGQAPAAADWRTEANKWALRARALWSARDRGDRRDRR